MFRVDFVKERTREWLSAIYQIFPKVNIATYRQQVRGSILNSLSRKDKK